VLLEFQRDWTRHATYEAARAIVVANGGGYGGNDDGHRPCGRSQLSRLEASSLLTLTLTGIAADSSLANGNNVRLARRIGSVLAVFSGAALGAVVIGAQP
jgi:hypothetical protein